MDSVFDEPASLQKLYTEYWDGGYDENNDEDADEYINGVANNFQIRFCDIYWCALAEQTNHDLVYEQNKQVYIPLMIGQEILPHWSYPLFPIMNMSLKQITCTLFGLEWYILCELYQPERNLNWVKEMQNFVNIIRYRLYRLHTEGSLSSNILDVEEDGYTELVLDQSRKRQITSSLLLDEDYYSDEEKQKKVKRQRTENVNWAEQFVTTTTKMEEDGACAPSTIKETQRRTTLAFVFDMNSTLRELDRHISRFIHIAPKVQWHETDDDVSSFRRYCVERLSRFDALVQKRKQWQHDLQCLPSHRVIYGRKTGKSNATSTEILSSMLATLVNKNIPTTLDELIAPPANVHRKAWKRVNTDFLFELLSSIEYENGDVFDYVVRHGIFTCLRINRKWLIHINDQIHGFESFTHAFIFYRRYCIKQNIQAVNYLFGDTEDGLPKKVDLSQYDTILKIN